MLTDLNILTPSIEQQIHQLLQGDRSQLVITSEYRNNPATDINHKYQNTIKTEEERELFNLYSKKMADYFSNKKTIDCFNIYQLPTDLEQEIFAQLPAKIQNMANPPYIRLQTMTNGDFLSPHSDYDRTAALLTIVSDNKETTCFWAQTEDHLWPGQTLPDIDRIEKVASACGRKGETWLFDVHEIHSVEREPGHDTDERVTINFRWSKTSMNEVIQTLL
jgi:hypothetical protein